MSKFDLTSIEDLIVGLLEDGEVETEPSPDRVGLKSSIGELFAGVDAEGTVHRIFIQFFVQTDLPLVPKDTEIGFTPDELVFQEGVVVADVEDQTDPPVYYGEVFPLDVFLNRFVSSPALTRRVQLLFHKLREEASPPDEWLEEASTLHNERIPGLDSFMGNAKKVC